MNVKAGQVVFVFLEEEIRNNSVQEKCTEFEWQSLSDALLCCPFPSGPTFSWPYPCIVCAASLVCRELMRGVLSSRCEFTPPWGLDPSSCTTFGTQREFPSRRVQLETTGEAPQSTQGPVQGSSGTRYPMAALRLVLLRPLLGHGRCFTGIAVAVIYSKVREAS